MYIIDGERAQQLRRELEAKWNRDVSQVEIAEIVMERLRARGVAIRGINRNTIGKIEHGRFRALDLEVLSEIAELYAENGLDASNILRYERRSIPAPQKNGGPVCA
jgi:hypothetical protein